MSSSSYLIFCLVIVSVVAGPSKILTPDQVPEGFYEPEYLDQPQQQDSALPTNAADASPSVSLVEVLETHELSNSAVVASSTQQLHASQASLFPLIPGPWLSSYAASIEDGVSIPPYIFNPSFVTGNYRPVLNLYSDGTPYPLNMVKFDYFGDTAAAPGAPAAPAAPAAPHVS